MAVKATKKKEDGFLFYVCVKKRKATKLEEGRGGELSPAATRDTLLLPHPLGRRTGENCLSKLRRVS